MTPEEVSAENHKRIERARVEMANQQRRMRKKQQAAAELERLKTGRANIEGLFPGLVKKEKK